MKTYIVQDWIATTEPEPFGDPINGKQATMSSGYFDKQIAVKVRDILGLLKQKEEEAKKNFNTGNAYIYRQLRKEIESSIVTAQMSKEGEKR